MTSKANQQSARLRRVTRPVRVLVTACVVALFSVTGFMMGHFFQTPDVVTAEQSAAPISVWASVEKRVVDDRQSFAAVVKAGATIVISARSTLEPAVLVRQGFSAGTVAKSGALAGVISGQPYFLLPEPLPLFRNLHLGDTGDDVLWLQRSLNAAGYPVIENSIVDDSLISRVAQLFQSDGFKLPISSENDAATQLPGVAKSTKTKAEPFIPYLQFLPIHSNGGTVVAALPVGAVVKADSALLSLQISDDYVEFIADTTQAAKLSVGKELTIRLGADEAKAKITAIDAFKDGVDGQKSGRPVRLVPTDPSVSQLLTENLSLTVLSDGGASAEVAVPLSAIRQDASGLYVEKRSDKTTTLRTPVSVVKSGGGYAAVSGDVRAGDEVLVS